MYVRGQVLLADPQWWGEAAMDSWWICMEQSVSAELNILRTWGCTYAHACIRSTCITCNFYALLTCARHIGSAVTSKWKTSSVLLLTAWNYIVKTMVPIVSQPFRLTGCDAVGSCDSTENWRSALKESQDVDKYTVVTKMQGNFLDSSYSQALTIPYQECATVNNDQ